MNNVTIADAVTTGLGSAVSIASGSTSTFSGRISGSGLGATGPGTVVLSSTSNIYTGGTSISGGGSVSVSNDANLGNTSGAISLNNGTLLTTTGINSSRSVGLSSLGGAISVSSGQTSTFSGQISGLGALTANGSGTLALGNMSNNYYGGTTIKGGGTLSVLNGSALGIGNLTINGSTLQTTGTSNSSVVGSIAIGNGATVNIMDASQTTTIGSVSGSGGLNVTGAGTLKLNGTSSFTGGITITGATIATGNDADLGDSSGGVTLNGGRLSVTSGGFLQTSRSFTLGSNGGTLIPNSFGPEAVLSGTVSGPGSLTLNGTGEAAVDNLSNTYSGGTVVTGGAVLQIAGDGSLGNSSGGVTLNNGTLDGPSAALTTARTITLGSGGGIIVPYSSSQTITLTGQVTGAGGLTVGQNMGGTVALSGTTNNYSGGTTVSFGTTLLLQNGTSGSATGSGSLSVSAAGTVMGVGTINASSFNFQSGSQVVVGTRLMDVTGQMTLTGQTASTFTGATLAFNLGSGANQGESNILNLGNTPITFTSTSLALSQIGSGTIPAHSVYTLLAFASPVNAAADGLTLGSNGQITGGLSIAANTDFGASTNGYTSGANTSGAYAGSYLFINGDDIDVEVVPEPDTWFMLLFGLSFLGLHLKFRDRRGEKRTAHFQ